MNMKINDLMHGFRITNVRRIEEIQADMYEMVHEKTTARCIWLKRDDENKTFSIAFKTTPVDDTGVFHILEHSVLNGSDRYPVREPFVDLLKGSLQTFLNAMTFPDKTVYPVSSRNDKDFINLMRVYLDAVFHPLALKNPNIFYQEGWHYELNEEDGQPIYKGVVFNEMKGAFSSPDGVRGRMMMHSLFPDSCYGFESGGDPLYITDLTYQQFCDNHRKHYSPRNSYIFLDGDMDIDTILGIIDDEYLSHYTSEGELIEITRQQPVKAEDVTIDYEVSPDSDGAGKAQVAYGYVIGSYDDYERTMAFNLLASVLCDSNESPLKKAIINAGLGEDISFDVQDGILQPYVEIAVINTDLDKEPQIRETIRQILQQAADNGVDRQELEAVLNNRELKARERDFYGAPKGLAFAITALDSWLYGGDPVNSLVFNPLFAGLREKLNTTYYEDLIREFLLNSAHCAKVMLRPSNTLGQQKAEDEARRLSEIAATWTPEQRQQLVEANRVLQTWQATEDTPEQKATLPQLHLEDLKTTPTAYHLKVASHNGTDNVIIHDPDTSGISYLALYINADDLEMKDYTVLGDMINLLGKLRTEKYDVLTLNRTIKSILGDFATGFTPMETYHDHTQKYLMQISWSALHRNNAAAADLIKEIIYHTDFSDSQAIHDILKQRLFMMEQMFVAAGNSAAVLRAAACSAPSAAVNEFTSGYEAYRYLKDLDENWDQKASDYLQALRDLQQKLFIRERYTFSVTADDPETIIKAIIDDAPSGQPGALKIKEAFGHRREAVIIPANISYAATSSALGDLVKNEGTMYVISNILTYDYLWNNIRVKGGAYGCGFRCQLGHQASFYSYRDPNPSNSLQIYKDTVKYLTEFCQRPESIENYIVGTTGDYDPLLSFKTGLKVSDMEYFSGLTYDDKCRILRQILDSNRKDVADAIALFEKVNEDDNVCVFGHKDAVDSCRGQLDEVFDLISGNKA